MEGQNTKQTAKDLATPITLHNNKWPWGETVHVVTAYGDAIVEMSFDKSNHGVCFISGLSVMPEIRRLGFATLLLEHCEAYCVSHNIFRIDLNSVMEQFVLDFYHKHGYVDIKEEDGFMQMYKLLR